MYENQFIPLRGDCRDLPGTENNPLQTVSAGVSGVRDCLHRCYRHQDCRAVSVSTSNQCILRRGTDIDVNDLFSTLTYAAYPAAAEKEICYVKDATRARAGWSPRWNYDRSFGHRAYGMAERCMFEFPCLTYADSSFGGWDIQNARPKTHKQCEEWCLSHADCTMYVWRDSDDRCYLKKPNLFSIFNLYHTGSHIVGVCPGPKHRSVCCPFLQVFLGGCADKCGSLEIRSSKTKLGYNETTGFPIVWNSGSPARSFSSYRSDIGELCQTSGASTEARYYLPFEIQLSLPDLRDSWYFRGGNAGNGSFAGSHTFASRADLLESFHQIVGNHFWSNIWESMRAWGVVVLPAVDREIVVSDVFLRVGNATVSAAQGNGTLLIRLALGAFRVQAEASSFLGGFETLSILEKAAALSPDASIISRTGSPTGLEWALSSITKIDSLGINAVTRLAPRECPAGEYDVEGILSPLYTHHAKNFTGEHPHPAVVVGMLCGVLQSAGGLQSAERDGDKI